MAIGVNSFKSAPVQQPVVTKPTETNPKSDSKMGTKTKVVIGTGLAALAAVGIYIATKGRGAKSIANNAEHIIQTPLKEITVNAFKESGNKFNKGKALLADGTTYTGEIVKENKDGSKFVMEYADGVLQKSTKTKGGEKLSEKLYSYDEKGVLNNIVDEKGKYLLRKEIKNNVEYIYTSKSLIRKDLENNKLKSLSISGGKYEEYHYDKNGDLDVVVGQLGESKYVKSYRNNQLETESRLEDMRKMDFYDKSGKVTDTLRFDDLRGRLNAREFEYRSPDGTTINFNRSLKFEDGAGNKGKFKSHGITINRVGFPREEYTFSNFDGGIDSYVRVGREKPREVTPEEKQSVKNLYKHVMNLISKAEDVKEKEIAI